MSDGINREEFQQWMGLLRDDIKGVHTRLDHLNGRTREVEGKVKVLESERSSDPVARWGAGIGAALSAALAYFK